jgi:tRNA-modifying protein YgfZ
MEPKPFALPCLRALAVTGPDAHGFLQGQLSSDLREVNAASGQFSAWHDPKGRVLAFLRVLPWPDGYLLLMHTELVEDIARRLRMYLLRARVDLRPGPPVHGLQAGHAQAWLAAHGLAHSSTPLAVSSTAGISAMRLPGEAGWLLAGVPAESAATERPAAVAAWARAELEVGIPEVYAATSGEFVAQMLNLDRLGAVSFTKGCFPGQEIVARAHHLGRVKRRARLFCAAGRPPLPGASLAGPGGTVVRACESPGGCLLSAVVPEDAVGPFALDDGRSLSPWMKP